MSVILQFPLPLSDATRAKARYFFCRAYAQGDFVNANQILALSRHDAELEAMLRSAPPETVPGTAHSETVENSKSK